jgi:hypothetical protein
VTARTRTIRYGAAAVLVVIGVACGELVPGTAGGTLATVLIGLGLILAVSMVFYEVGLTEDRDRAQRRPLDEPPPDDESDPPHEPRPPRTAHPPHDVARPRGPDRMRGQRRRLR